MRNPASIRSRAVVLFREAGINNDNIDDFDSNVLARRTSDVVNTLILEFGEDVVIDFVNASFKKGGVKLLLNS